VSRGCVLSLFAALALLVNAPAVHADPVVAAAGDIACASSAQQASSCRQMATSNILVGMNPLDGVLALGDLQYECGELANFRSFYDASWGRVKNKTHPVPGNHEYQTSGCSSATPAGAGGYFKYFGDAATPRQPGCVLSCKGYYSYDLGAWHIVALNSNCGRVGGCGAGSPQETWLRSDLATTTQSCILAYWHHPRYASAGGASTGVQPLWATLWDGGTDLVLAGHSHTYERFGRLGRGTVGSAEPTLDAGGMREFIVGTGGKSHGAFKAARTGSQVRNDQTFGVLKLALHTGRYDWTFLPEAGKTFSDSGGDTCQGAPRSGDTRPPSAAAFRSSSFVSSSTTTTSLRVAAPAGTAVGDVMVASVNVRGLPTITAPLGWNLLRTDVNSTVMTMATYYRVVKVGEPLAYTWSFSLKKAAAGGIVAYSGVDTATPIDASDGLVKASSATITAPSITTTVPETRLVGFFGTATRTTVTPPAGMTERGDVASTFGTDATLEGSDSVLSAAGASGQQNATAAASARNIGHLVALRPAP
jgi:acid phosphatase type 7